MSSRRCLRRSTNMAKIKVEKKEQRLLRRGPQDSETDWRDPWKATEEARRTIFTKEDFLRDLETVSRHITNEINKDPKEVAKLRKSIAQAKSGQRRPYRTGRAEKSS